MSTDLLLQLVVAAIAVGCWGTYVALSGWASPIKAGVLLALSCGMLLVSWIALNGPMELLGATINASMVATVNRAFVAAVGMSLATRSLVRRWEARQPPGDREA